MTLKTSRLAACNKSSSAAVQCEMAGEYYNDLASFKVTLQSKEWLHALSWERRHHEGGLYCPVLRFDHQLPIYVSGDVLVKKSSESFPAHLQSNKYLTVEIL